MEENRPKITWQKLIPEIGCILLAVLGVGGMGVLNRTSVDAVLSNIVLSVAGIMILGFHMRQAYLEQELDYDNGEHYYRFWVCFLMGLAGAFICAYLPIAGWPYMAIYVLLALFTNMSTGILAGTVLLVISVMLSHGTTVIFVLYFLTGIFAVTMFRKLDDSFKIGMRMLLSLLCLLVCETAAVVLLANERLSLELLVIPGANIIISGIMLLGILKMFSSLVIYKYREKYLELNDTENPILVEYRTNSRDEYMHGVHTAYFCERIATKLFLNGDELKCAGYYHKLVKASPQLLEEQQFPPGVKTILQDYMEHKDAVTRKETAVLVCADTVMSTMQYLISKSQERGLNYDYIIDNVFKRFTEVDTFGNCDITMQEIKTMQNIFKEEKLYYDFLR